MLSKFPRSVLPWARISTPPTMTRCDSQSGGRSAPLGEGGARRYPANLKTTLAAARDSVSQAGLIVESIERSDEQTWMILSTAKASFWSSDEIVRVVVQASPDAGTIVRVLTKRRLGTNSAANDH